MQPPRPSPSVARLITAVGTMAVLAAVLPAAASAHSFLIRSTAAAGARLADSPATLTLDFSEPYVRGSERITIRPPGGSPLTLPAPNGRASFIRQPLPSKLHGVLVVSWQVLSDDGHLSLGDFAFAVGSAAALPKLSADTSGTSYSGVVASWLFFLGLALAAGGLVSERFVWRKRDGEVSVPRAPVVLGLAVAAAGSFMELVLVAGGLRGGGFGSGLSFSALGDALDTRPGVLTLVSLCALATAARLLRSRLRLVACIPLLAAIVAEAMRGHSGTSGYAWATAADVVHLAAVAVWLGALVHLLVIIVRVPERRAVLAGGAGRYSALALPTVLVIGASGILTALPEFRSIGEVVSSSYGRTLVIKSGLVALALVLAAAARWRTLSGNPHPRLPLLRRLAGGEALVLLGVLVAAALLANDAPPRSFAAARRAPQLGPPPIGPAVQLADFAGQLGIAVAASKDELRFTILPPTGQSPGAVRVTAQALAPNERSHDLYPRPCGTSCFTIHYRLRAGITHLTV